MYYNMLCNIYIYIYIYIQREREKERCLFIYNMIIEYIIRASMKVRMP